MTTLAYPEGSWIEFPTRSAKVLSIEVFMDGSSLPTAGTWSRSIILFASRTVAASVGSSMWQLHFSATVFTPWYNNCCGTSLAQGRCKTLNGRGHVRVVTSQYPGSFADRYEHSSARPMGWRDRVERGCESIRRVFWGLRFQDRNNISRYCIHGYLPLVLGSSDPGAHRAQIANGSLAAFCNGSLRRLDFTPLCQNQLIFGAFEGITQRR